jgi:predicted ATP-grasp superfamily ATP-dependent carboligase
MKVLVFGDDTGPCLAAARSFARRGIEVHLTTQDGQGAASRSRFVARVHPLPLYRGDGAGWLEALREICAAHAYVLLVPTSDSSLEQLLKHQADLPGMTLAVPNPEAAAAFTDKALTRQLAMELEVPIAEGTRIEKIDGRWGLEADLPLPVVLKRRRSYRCGEPDQKAPVLLVDSPCKLQRAIGTGRFDLAESALPGFCRGVSVLARGGRVLAAHQHRRLRQKHATGPSSSRISEPCDPQLLEWTERLVAETALTGVAMFEYRHDPDGGRTVLLEVNPRLWGSLPLALAAGADFPALLLAMLVAGQAPPRQVGSRAGVLKLNLGYEVYALSASAGRARGLRERLGLWARAGLLAARLLTGRAFDSWAPDDPEPFRAERWQVLSAVRGALRQRVRGAWRPRLGAAG